MGKKLKRGKAGSAVQYVTRNQALKKLQLHLSDFRRLCILKGVHPREPRKKSQGRDKTYYHVKDINFLAHESLLNRFRDAHAYERKIRKAKAKRNADLAARLASRQPGYQLDHLVRERYPSFLDALRDLDDPLTLLHLFSGLPAEKVHSIPAKAVQTARSLTLEWQSYIVRTHALRKVFVSVKGFYYQVEVLGQQITWLVPHQLAQVLPNDVDFRVMLTFLEFYQTLLKFVNFKLYHIIGLPYPPSADPKLQAAAADLASIMQDLARQQPPQIAASQQDSIVPSLPAAAAPDAELPELPPSTAGKQRQRQRQERQEDADLDSDSEASGSDEDSLPSIQSGEEDSDSEAGSSSDTSEQEPLLAEDEDQSAAAGAGTEIEPHLQPTVLPEPDAEPGDPPGVAHEGEPEDEGELCASVFRGLVFFLAREVPQEALLLIIRAFGGNAGWQGHGSPFEEGDESITHQVVDRPAQGHKFLSRDYIQPQWVLDSANFRVLADARLYAPGISPPPHLSPFVAPGEDDYVPDYARSLMHLQEAARAARRRGQGRRLEQAFLAGAEADGDVSRQQPSAEDVEAAAEQQYAAELAAEVQGQQAVSTEALQEVKSADRAAEADTAEDADEEAMKKSLMPRKHRMAYESIQRGRKAKRARVAGLEAKRQALTAQSVVTAKGK